MKSAYGFIGKQWDKQGKELKILLKSRVVEWRKQHTVERINKPTRLDRARTLGYKAKKGYVLARVKVRKGGRSRKAYHKGRKPAHAGLTHFTSKNSAQAIAEMKANRKFKNLEVLGSYVVGEDGMYKFFEIFMCDPQNPNIMNDPKTNWVCNPANRRRAFRGLTSAGKKARF